MKGVLIGVVAVISSVLALLKSCEYLENPKSHYASFSEARNAGALAEGGWLPDLLPKSATDITEQHNIDTNAMWLAFTFSGAPFSSTPKGCVLAKAPPQHDGAPRWWRRDARAVGTSGDRFQLSSSRRIDGILARQPLLSSGGTIKGGI
jgi:hypothetical protein